MSQSHGRATAQNFPDFAPNLEICMRELKKLWILTSFKFFLHDFGLIFAFFLAQNCITKILTAQKNLLLECLLFFKPSILPKYVYESNKYFSYHTKPYHGGPLYHRS